MLSASAPAKRRRDTAVLTAGILLVTAITFAAGSFPETGNGAMVAFAETPGESGGQEEGTHDGNTDEEKRDPESIMAAEEAADTENGTETRKEEAENGAETPEGGEAGEGEDPDQEAETAAEGSGEGWLRLCAGDLLQLRGHREAPRLPPDAADDLPHALRRALRRPAHVPGQPGAAL